MNDRIVIFLYALAGVGLAVGLVLLGYDLHASSKTGPRWKRRILASALALLSSFGLIWVDKQARLPQSSRGFTGGGVVMCYRVAPPQPQAPLTIGAIATRLTLVERYAQEEKLNVEAVLPVLGAIAEDFQRLERETQAVPLTTADLEKLQAAQQKLTTLLERIKTAAPQLPHDQPGLFKALATDASPGAKTLLMTQEWQTVMAAWNEAGPLARSGRSTTAQRQWAQERLDAAVRAVHALTIVGLLTVQEAELLRGDAANLSADMVRTPPTDFRGTCYDMAILPPAQQSFQRIAARLPLLEKLLAEGKIQPPAGAKIIAGMEADLAVLTQEKELAALEAGEQAKAVEARDAAKAQLETLKALLEGPR